MHFKTVVPRDAHGVLVIDNGDSPDLLSDGEDTRFAEVPSRIRDANSPHPLRKTKQAGGIVKGEYFDPSQVKDVMKLRMEFAAFHDLISNDARRHAASLSHEIAEDIKPIRPSKMNELCCIEYQLRI